MRSSSAILGAWLLFFSACAAPGARRELQPQSAVPVPSASAASAQPPPAAPAPSDNPLFTESSLPFHAPAFDKLRDAHFLPAFEEGMKRELAEVERIADNPDAPTFENTIVALERSGRMLTRVSNIFGVLTSANTNAELQRVDETISPKLSVHRDAIALNPKLYSRVKALYEKRASLKLDPESLRLLERSQRDFVRAGAALSPTDQATLRDLNQEMSALATKFQNKLLAATKEGALVVGDKVELEGLDEHELSAAADAAKTRNLEGKWVIPLQNTTQQPALASLKNRALREKLFEASIHRADHGGDSDTRAIVLRLAELRARKAKLLGYATFAQYALEYQMAKTSERATELLKNVLAAAKSKATSEALGMQKFARKDHVKLAPWDLQFYQEQVKRNDYALDQQELQQYFDLNRVLVDGVFFAANKLYGLTFKERQDIPVYHPDVRVFEVFDKDGSSLALFYADLFKRDDKVGGAWTNTIQAQSALLDTKPVVTSSCNFSKPGPDQPALISQDNVTTLFHEFGHVLHGILSRVKYPYFSGMAVPRDFVEFPSQFNEHWADEPSVLANYAKHYRTGESMPEKLLAKVRRAQKYGQGYATTEHVAAALLDQAWHDVSSDAPPKDVDTFEKEALVRYGAENPLIPPRYRSSYFAHIWDGGYSARYYAYTWTAVLRDDAFYWFKEHGGMTRENGQRFRDVILSRGSTEEADALYRELTGREPRVEPMLNERGLIKNKY